ncbi:jmjC domain-containing protein 8 isoform X2 [Siniperca chuatsi]|uniref:jmjC domain-containing protein 8 isoform X2 n=1 Tax=Siniperca chuatsi TaxID=119488 RepID=UPI001CE124AA|nr:jmjC domain-containing protein 8 isoform X2 [Siniperca chuatsi]
MEYNSALLNTCTQFVLLCFIVLKAEEPSADGGGWSSDSDFSLQDEGPCNIDVLGSSSLSHQQFIERYAYSRPVILRGLTDNTKFRSLCSKSSLLEEYGDRRVRLSTANTYSYRKVDVPFQEYVDVFLRPQSSDALGSGPGTGVPFHWHGPGYSEVIYGRKRWFLYPPDREPHFHPNRTTLSWVTETYPHLPEVEAPLECTIRPGRCCISPTAGGTPLSTWTPAFSSPPSSVELQLAWIFFFFF